MTVYAVFLGQTGSSVKQLAGYKERFEKAVSEEVRILLPDDLRDIVNKFDDRVSSFSGPVPAHRGGSDTLLVFATSSEDRQSFGFHQVHIRVPTIPVGSQGIYRDFLNRIENLIVRGRKVADRVRSLMAESYSTTPLLLPFRNFEDPSVKSFFSSMQSENLLHIFSSNAEVFSWLEQECKSLRALRRPRRSRLSKGWHEQKKAYHDLNGRAFQFANFDLHGADPSATAHTLSCVVNGYFRFGARINSAHHFDVTSSDGKSLAHFHFVSCHGTEKEQCGGSRCNMWSNDFRIDKN